MARQKNAPESVRLKQSLSERLRELRTEFFGERGGPDMARTLGILVRTWYNYESGVTVPAEIILQVVELTSVEPVWLLRGEGPKFRPMTTGLSPGDGLQTSSVTNLLRAALDRLEQREKFKIETEAAYSVAEPMVAYREDLETCRDGSCLIYLGNGKLTNGQSFTPDDGQRYDAARHEWLSARRKLRHLQVSDDSMAPIIADGAHVTYAEVEPASANLHDKLVVTQVDAQPVVRWYQHCGRFALLRSENVAVNPSSTLVELDGENLGQTFHRVVWICTPH